MFDIWIKARKQGLTSAARRISEEMREDMRSPKAAQLRTAFSAQEWHASVDAHCMETKNKVLELAARYHGQAAGITLAARSLESVLGEGVFHTNQYLTLLNGAFALDLTHALLSSNLPSPLVSSILGHLEERYFGNDSTASSKTRADAGVPTADLSRRIAEIVYTSFDQYANRQARHKQARVFSDPRRPKQKLSDL